MLDPIQSAAAEQFSRQSKNYGKNHILADVTDVNDALARIDIPPNSRVLDVACGGGHTGLRLAEIGHAVTLADISEAMLERVREAAAQRGLKIETRCHPAECFPYADGQFALVTCRVAAHHFSSIPSFLGEVARVLQPGGYFLLIDGSIEDLKAEAEEWLHEVEKLRDPSHVRFRTPANWKQLCESAGLSVRNSALYPKKQPDLEWYFDAAATSAENRAQVRQLVAHAPPQARELLKLQEESGKIVWWWQILSMIARKDR